MIGYFHFGERSRLPGRKAKANICQNRKSNEITTFSQRIHIEPSGFFFSIIYVDSCYSINRTKAYLMRGISVILINQSGRDGETFIRNVFFIFRMVSYPVDIQHRFFARSQWSNIQFYFNIGFVFFVFQMIQIFILVHQAFVIGSVDETCTGTLGCLVQP